MKQEEAREAAVAARGCEVGDDERARGGGVARSTRRAAEAAVWLATSQSNWTGLQLRLASMLVATAVRVGILTFRWVPNPTF